MVKLVLFDIDGTLVHTGPRRHAGFSPRPLPPSSKPTTAWKKMKFARSAPMSASSANFSNTMTFPPRRKIFNASLKIAFSGSTRFSRRSKTENLSRRPGTAARPARVAETADASACSPAISVSARKSSYAILDCGNNSSSGGFADDHEETRFDRRRCARAQPSRVLGRKLRGEEMVVIGDTPFDVRCGKAIGAKVLAVATGGAKVDELKKCGPDWAVENLTQISAREICSM